MNELMRNEIHSRRLAGESQRGIARALGLSRNTVSRVLDGVQGARDGQTSPTQPRQPSLLDAHEATLRALLDRYPNLTATRALEELRKSGFTGGYTLVRCRIQQLRPRQRLPVVRFETAPGQQAQMDYSTYTIDFTEEGRRRVHLFSYVLGYSRRQYLRFVETQDLATTLREHVHAFEHLGGVAATCLYDNMKVVVTSHDDAGPVYNARFLAFATHYGFRPHACRVRRPQTKGKVERPFHYVETNLLNGRTFRTLAHLNEVTVGWMAEVADVRIHAQTHETPLARHAQERPCLIPLPAAAYEVAPVVYRTVTVEGFINYQQNRYSVPWRLIGQLLAVRVTENEIIVYSPQLEELTRHLLFPRAMTGQCRERPEHRPSTDPREREAALRGRFQELGKTAIDFLDGLLQSQRYGKEQAQHVLALLGTYAQADVLAAFERAVCYGAYSRATVERILATQARPKSLLETQSEEERQHLPSALCSAPVAARPTSDYQPLLSEEPPNHGPTPEESHNTTDGTA